jgi:hypothetical protein
MLIPVTLQSDWAGKPGGFESLRSLHSFPIHSIDVRRQGSCLQPLHNAGMTKQLPRRTELGAKEPSPR